jgi:hypothetical protein
MEFLPGGRVAHVGSTPLPEHLDYDVDTTLRYRHAQTNGEVRCFTGMKCKEGIDLALERAGVVGRDGCGPRGRSDAFGGMSAKTSAMSRVSEVNTGFFFVGLSNDKTRAGRWEQMFLRGEFARWNDDLFGD